MDYKIPRGDPVPASWAGVLEREDKHMEISRVRNLGDEELKLEQSKAGEQLFRLRFQLTLGQKEGVKKLRELKQAVARIKTIERERALGIRGATALAEGQPDLAGKARKGKR